MVVISAAVSDVGFGLCLKASVGRAGMSLILTIFLISVRSQ